MKSFDLFHESKAFVALQAQAIGSSTTTTGEIIDRFGFEAATFILQTGAVTDGDYTLALYESDDSGMSGEAVIAAANRSGDLPAFTADTDDAAAEHCTVRPTMRYLRAKVVSANVSSGAAGVAVAALLHGAHSAPAVTNAHVAITQTP